MLLVAALTPAAEAASNTVFMEICTAEGIVFLPADQLLEQGDGRPAEKHDSGGGLESCPVCSAFGQQSLSGPPASIVLAPDCTAQDRPVAQGKVTLRRQAVNLPRTRAPPV
ncbi:DUF2946 family protein [Pelagibius litoralis]|uniref:DUF2946 family protein n=1 Tax=Pelagibius litoralis TaxID=374515 RepID=A0A967K826_9PROT|nr:DUF2946 family protein [Pelagibius litoralis]NIA70198.1 DUF2946 family protein [Pelagibius litoralis]